MRRADLVRRIEQVPTPAHPNAGLEQVMTPAEAAAELLFSAMSTGDLVGRTVLDLGAGTGRLTIGAALLGAKRVTGIEVDAELVAAAVAAARAAKVKVDFVRGEVASWSQPGEVVLMNPPFGAQRPHADRPFWDAAYRLATRSIYAFALAESRTFIARRAVDAGAHVLAARPVAWGLPRTFPHHTRRRVELAVDLWAIRTERAS
ncbi:MAG: methyltransferase [Thermoplasmata archaeon]